MRNAGWFGPIGRPGLICLILSAFAGALFNILHVPLGWVLGPMLATTGFAMAGYTPIAPVAGRRAGQMLVGCAIGLHLTQPVLVNLGLWLPLMIGAGLLAILAGAALSIPFGRLGRLDRKTAFYAMVPGGLSEMANIGASKGAELEPIALSQALRIGVVVLLLPPVILAFGADGGLLNAAAKHSLPLERLPVLFAFAAGGIFFIHKLRLNNPWMIGAVTGAAFPTAFGMTEGLLPLPLFYAAQFLIGIAIGARFRRSIVAKLARLSVISVGFTLLMMAICFAIAWGVSGLSGIGLASAVLATSPGGFAEMAATAKTLHLEVALVAGFHIVRSFLVNGLTTYIEAFLERTGFFDAIDWLCRKIY